jgi:PhnB protein
MVQSPPEGFHRVTPYLLYEDVDAAVDWLITVCGFHERFRMAGPDGKTMHAEVGMADGVVMLGNPGPDYRNPVQLGGATQLIYVYVDDVDAHHQAIQDAGAKVVREIADQFYGDRSYSVEDPEGHTWNFGQHIRDVAPEEMHP